MDWEEDGPLRDEKRAGLFRQSSGLLRSAVTTCRQSATATATTGYLYGDSVLDLGLQREILGFYHKLYYTKNAPARNVAVNIAANFAYLLRQEVAMKLCVMTQLGFLQDSLISLQNILNFYTASNAATVFFPCWDEKVAEVSASGDCEHDEREWWGRGDDRRWFN
ncbi:unnamed protein product [Darwinula stevensoni]|uniref:Uncharacterized protein n=1 Tax=Darwinula stevensoni TaxID=69355 RepID=A0A7R9A928_9CRUS|nr:unnamed protein product [Darwinula stevensoni]CAG0897004.1 unnamed protein product [Darwinula stevensoni]